MIRYQILQVDMHYKFSSGEHCLSLSRVHLFAAPRTVACQAPLSMKLPRQEYWKDCHFLLNGLFLTQDRTRVSCLADGFFIPEPPGTQHCMLCVVAQSCPAFCDPVDCSPPGSSVHGNSPGKNTGVGCHALLQGIFSTQGSNPGLLHCRWIFFTI